MPRAPIPVASILRNFQADFSSKIAPLEIAEKWDNVGFLVESARSNSYEKLKILTCIDLTPEVVTEAINHDCNMIFSYHPLMFRPIQSLSIMHQGPILRCLDSGISIFSPHTALDNAKNGMNDFLCDFFIAYESSRDGVKSDPVSGLQSGRLSRFSSLIPLNNIIQTLKEKLKMQSIRFASPSGTTDHMIDSVGVCVGSGSSVLSGSDASLYLTGEMSHHEILACISLGKCVILLDHSSSERPFLPELARRLRGFENVESVRVSENDTEPIRTA